MQSTLGDTGSLSLNVFRSFFYQVRVIIISYFIHSSYMIIHYIHSQYNSFQSRLHLCIIDVVNYILMQNEITVVSY